MRTHTHHTHGCVLASEVDKETEAQKGKEVDDDEDDDNCSDESNGRHEYIVYALCAMRVCALWR